jgi:fatty-acyl-CoA synthase
VLLGAIHTGARVVSLPLPARSADIGTYLDFLRTATESEGAAELVVSDEVAALLEGTGLPVRTHSELGGAPVAAPASGGFELVQFSSGSTDRPKAVRLSDAAVGANVATILRTLEPRPGDMSVSWLPLSHDMGLIGLLFTSIAAGSTAFAGEGDIVLLDPTHFLRSPQLWLDAMSRWGCTVTAAPDFGYRLATERGRTESLDLSSLRCVITGGEVVRAATLHTFAERFAPAGFRTQAFCPSYGMAEIGLAASITPIDAEWRTHAVRSLALAEHRLEEAPPTASADDGTVVLVASGLPIEGYEIRCEAGPGGVGPLSVRGPSIGVDGATGESFADADGWYATGDYGYLLDGWVYVAGRADDHVVANGRNIYAPAVEQAIGDVEGVRAGRAAIVGVPSGDWIALVEPETGKVLSDSEVRTLVQSVHRATVGVAAVRPADVVIVPRGALPYTPSGKLQRGEVVRRHLAGELGA